MPCCRRCRSQAAAQNNALPACLWQQRTCDHQGILFYQLTLSVVQHCWTVSWCGTSPQPAGGGQQWHRTCLPVQLVQASSEPYYISAACISSHNGSAGCWHAHPRRLPAVRAGQHAMGTEWLHGFSPQVSRVADRLHKASGALSSCHWQQLAAWRVGEQGQSLCSAHGHSAPLVSCYLSMASTPGGNGIAAGPDRRLATSASRGSGLQLGCGPGPL